VTRGLDPKACDRARLARDPRFDGRFFTGVLTTRIYCRPTGPVKPAQSRNVVFFPTAAAASAPAFARACAVVRSRHRARRPGAAPAPA
jgi:methylphosphotriester-DNA--protein-cysteine methyltransferase